MQWIEAMRQVDRGDAPSVGISYGNAEGWIADGKVYKDWATWRAQTPTKLPTEAQTRAAQARGLANEAYNRESMKNVKAQPRPSGKGEVPLYMRSGVVPTKTGSLPSVRDDAVRDLVGPRITPPPRPPPPTPPKKPMTHYERGIAAYEVQEKHRRALARLLSQ
jgi:hypothetical protein